MLTSIGKQKCESSSGKEGFGKLEHLSKVVPNIVT